MGQILKTKLIPSGKVIVQIELTQIEAQSLKNHTKRIHLFSENLCTHEAKIIERGAKKGSKLITIPLSLKTRTKTKLTEVSCQKLEAPEKIFYITTATKNPLEEN